MPQKDSQTTQTMSKQLKADLDRIAQLESEKREVSVSTPELLKLFVRKYDSGEVTL